MTHRWLLLIVFLIGVPAPLDAALLVPAEVPKLLQPWIPWVLHGHEEHRCPFFYNNGDQHRCAWPSRLELHLEARGGGFSQQWLMESDGWLTLPGDAQQWPQEVQLDDQRALVSERNGMPSVYVQAGNHTVRGLFVWQKMPQTLQVPSETGLVTLQLGDKVVDFPDLDSNGKLWLRQSATQTSTEEDRLELKVYRRIVDEIPLQVTTRINLQVAGRQREVVLGPVISSDYIPLSLDSPVPARLEPDGRLRMQLRPGLWSLTLSARHPGVSVDAVMLPKPTQPWVDEEVWVFDARPSLRVVAVEGVPAIDPQQTSLPGDWRLLPAYRIQPGETMRIIEKKRGDPDPPPDQLTLERHLWLDFTGGGYTIQDHIGGVMTRGWRLEINPPARLGRVVVDGHEQLITRTADSQRAGIEVRRGQLSLVADSRMEGRLSSLPAIGWERDFHQLSGILHLPPGWSVLTASGVDAISTTWMQQWTLLDLFLVLILALSVARLWGRLWGLTALLTLALIYHEADAPRWVWLHVLAAVALLRVLPTGQVRHLAQFYRIISLSVLIVMTIPFMVQQARQGLYPQLERPWQVVGEPSSAQKREVVGAAMGGGGGAMHKSKDELVVLPSHAPMADGAENLGDLPGLLAMSEAPYREQKVLDSSQEQARVLAHYDPDAMIQTGPGMPQWQWTTIPMHWSGPVQRGQQLQLVLIPPWGNLLLAFLRVLLLTVLVVRVLDVRYTPSSGFSFSSGSTAVIAVLLCCVFFLPRSAIAQDAFPSLQLLNELRARLLEQPECVPHCASSPRLRLELTEDSLLVRMEIHAAAAVVVPLPGQAQHWLPQQVLVNGKPARGLFRAAGYLWITVPLGQHQIVLTGLLPQRATVQLPLPLKPHRIEASAQGWAVEGVDPDGVAADQLEFRRLRRDTDAKTTPSLEAGPLPPFVLVERTLHFALTWQVDTRVIRLSPRGAAVVLEVPLLAGESVTTEHVRVESGKALVHLAPQATEARWSSVLTPRDQLALVAPESTVWTEVWRLDVSPIWHVETSGIPVIHHSDRSSGYWLPQWRPWPGENVTLQITRPQGVPGRTLTIDSSHLTVTPGQRATDVGLRLSLRSSRGGQHQLTLPENARLQSVNINGQTQPIRQDEHVVTVPLTPGSQTVELLWQQPEGMQRRLTTPAVDVGIDSVNAHVQVQMPHDRWVLLTGGSRIGPAVLIWAVGLIIVLVALALGRVSFMPLRTHHWLLLGVGLSPVSIEIAILVVGWLLALGLRRRLSAETTAWIFNLVQMALVGLTIGAILALFYAIRQGLLGHPDMQIAGNGSTSMLLRWYQDRADTTLPRAWVFSVPLIVYRMLMLAWALWLAFALLRWLRWGWECVSTSGLWRRSRAAKSVAATQSDG